MILYPPESFDFNEWVVIAQCAVLLGVFIRLPRRLPRSATLVIWVFCMYLVRQIDFTIAVKPLNYYDWMDRTQYEIFDALMYLLVYPIFGYLYVHLLDKHQFRGLRFVLYVLGWTLFSTVYEWINVVSQVLNYKGWKLLYSPPFYLATFLLLTFLYRLLRRYHPAMAPLQHAQKGDRAPR